MRQGTGHQRQAHENGDVAGRETEILRKDRAEGAEGPVGHADEKHADRPHRRQIDDRPEIETHLLRRLRRRKAGKRRRDVRDGKQETRNHEQRDLHRIKQGQRHLTGGNRPQIDDHVNRKDAAPRVIGDAGIEPAFDHHGGPGDGEADDETRCEPHHRFDDHALQKHAGGSQRGNDAECPDVSYAPQRNRNEVATRYETQRIGRAHEADNDIAIAFQTGADRHEKALLAGGQIHEQGGHEKDGDRKNALSHAGLSVGDRRNCVAREAEHPLAHPALTLCNAGKLWRFRGGCRANQ